MAKEISIIEKNYAASVRNHLNPRFGNCKLKEITTSQISEFLTTLDVKGSTSRKQKIVLKVFLSMQ